mmetsp:Transcript_5178/g.10302  ORF Transcript_5178/g.10302 Transcript_5178/m.10302 type:complete len:125 (-) Transcript_5178:69-443(-)|eukprot:CAMPEP_0118659996 /NCGR_PEP_ID=MMETSP0785-20121206/15418_1 /TAXON_ID=91992 /ORGANISM="Bolidomonas pacifica, Strain CCMP 1866" /LENGTH=124 /DNA_ID=CAMNT_0006553155 /DNA_START=78 /DNA_END=452 /DNA_ORIENTATION=+
MGWFGGGSSTPEEAPRDFSSSDDSAFASSPMQTSQGQAMGTAGMGSTGIEQFAMEQQQRMAIQKVVSKLTQIAFDKCISTPDSSLSSSEVSCIHAVTGKYLDGSEFVVKRLQRAQGNGRDQLLS